MFKAESKKYDSFRISNRLVLSTTGIFIIFILFSIFLTACKSKVIVSESSSELSGTEKILILTFKDMTKIYDEDANVRCPVCGKFFITGQVSEKAVKTLTDSLVSYLKKHTNYKIVVSGMVAGDLPENSLKKGQKFSERRLIVKAGNTRRADAVMAGYVYRYEERIGTRYSIKSPASVAFGIHLISMKNGSNIWSGHFDETQHSLDKNLFKLGTFIKRKASWITADEMAISGLEDILEKFPNP